MYIYFSLFLDNIILYLFDLKFSIAVWKRACAQINNNIKWQSFNFERRK